MCHMKVLLQTLVGKYWVFGLKTVHIKAIETFWRTEWSAALALIGHLSYFISLNLVASKYENVVTSF